MIDSEHRQVFTTACRKIGGLHKKIRLVYGGQGAGKTYGICQILLGFSQHYNDNRTLVFGAEGTKLSLRAGHEFASIASPYIARGEIIKTKTPHSYLFPSTGSSVRFLGLDDEGLGKSIRGNIAYFNEVNEIRKFQAFKEIADRFEIVYADFNPLSKFFIDDIRRQYAGDIEELVLTYNDNEMIKHSELTAIKRIIELGQNAPVGSPDWYEWQVKALGNFAAKGGGVFGGKVEECSVEEYESIRATEFLGFDWGDTIDPNAVVGIKIVGDTIFAREYLYRSRMSDMEVHSEIRDINCEFGVYDTGSGGNTRARNLENYGLKFPMYPCKKGAGSVSAGIYNLREFKIKACGVNMYRELSNYISTDDGFVGDDHLIDALRYIHGYLLLYRFI